MYWDNGHMNSGWGIAMVLVMMGFWLLIAVAITWAVLALRTHTSSAHVSAGSQGTQVAEQILAERLAHGDIDPEEYAARLSALHTSRRHT